MFILSALDKRGSFHAAKVIIFTRICNFYRQKIERQPQDEVTSLFR